MKAKFESKILDAHSQDKKKIFIFQDSKCKDMKATLESKILKDILKSVQE